jgi:hypothetical protein
MPALPAEFLIVADLERYGDSMRNLKTSLKERGLFLFVFLCHCKGRPKHK